MVEYTYISFHSEFACVCVYIYTYASRVYVCVCIYVYMHTEFTCGRAYLRICTPRLHVFVYICSFHIRECVYFHMCADITFVCVYTYNNQQITVSHFGEYKRLHLESSKQNYYIISLRAIIKTIFNSMCVCVCVCVRVRVCIVTLIGSLGPMCLTGDLLNLPNIWICLGFEMIPLERRMDPMGWLRLAGCLKL